MLQPDSLPEIGSEDAGQQPGPQSLRELIDLVTGRGGSKEKRETDAGIAEQLPFPFVALVGQNDMKLALLLAAINPALGGVLLLGPRGTGKTTAVRSLADLLPQVTRSLCFYGCLPEDIEASGIDAVCPECAKKFGEGLPLSYQDQVRLVELPLNARLEDVVGGLDERALVHERLRLRRGILAQADRNILYVDEVNLLANDVVNAILDAAAQGSYTVRRGPVSSTYNSRFVLIGSMNPEEGSLRPQIMDRFGLRVVVRGLVDPEERLIAYHRVEEYLHNPRLLINTFSQMTVEMQQDVQAARALLPEVDLDDQTARQGILIIQRLGIDSLRAEITLFESARAYAAMDGRKVACIDDLRAVAPMSLRLRRSSYIKQYFANQAAEEKEFVTVIDEITSSQ